MFITGWKQENLDEALTAIGRNVTGMQGDSAKLAHLDRLFETVDWKKVYEDVVFASAGHGRSIIMNGSIAHLKGIPGLSVMPEARRRFGRSHDRG